MFEKTNPSRRSKLLYPMLFASIFLWAFIGASLLLCTAFLKEYEVNRSIGRLVFGGSIIASLVFSSVLTVAARKFAAPRILSSMAAESYSDRRLWETFAKLSVRMGIVGAELREARIGNAFSVSVKGRKLVAVSPSLVQSLTPEEAEAVLAHELSHLKNRDSVAKGLARLARFAFPFDPVIRLTEAAVHRERELLADVSSVKYTQKPLALASALIRVHSGSVSSIQGIGAGLFVGSNGHGLFSLYPDLQRRIELLLKMADRLKASQEIPA